MRTIVSVQLEGAVTVRIVRIARDWRGRYVLVETRVGCDPPTQQRLYAQSVMKFDVNGEWHVGGSGDATSS